MPEVRTVLGPVEAGELGAVDAHEHLFLRSPHLPGEEFGDVDRTAEELGHVRASGAATVVDLTPIGLGRDPRALAEVSRRTGVHVVAATGYHRDAHYAPGHWALRADVGTLTAPVLTDLTEGMDARDWQGPVPDPTPHRAGIVKAGASYQRLTPAERRRLTACARAAARAGVPVAVHCEVGTAAHLVLDLLAAEGVPAGRVVLAHMDRNPDPELHLELTGRGAALVYDTVGRIKYRPDSALLELVEAVVSGGGGGSLLLGTDVGRRSTLRAYGGGPGMDVLFREFVPRLRKRLGEDVAHALTRANPQRVLALTTPAAKENRT